MDSLDRMWQDTRGLIRRDRRQGAVDRALLYEMVGGPRFQSRRLGAGPMRHLVGREGPQVSVPIDGRLEIPPEMRVFQASAPSLVEERCGTCCHCLRRADRQTAAPPPSATSPSTFPFIRLSEAYLESLHVDAHSHLFAYSMGDFLASLLLYWVSPTTETFARIGWLVDHMGAAGIRQTVLSGFLDSTIDPEPLRAIGDWRLGERSPRERDYSVLLARALHPDFVLPMTNGFDLNDREGALDDLDAELALFSGWKGIGEIIVQGHGRVASDDDVATLRQILERGADLGLPVALHWDIGGVDSGGPPKAKESFSRLDALLDAVPDAEVVLCHCGLGPQDTWTPEVEAEWEARYLAPGAGLTALMDRPNLHFDLAGMQIGGNQQLVRATGKLTDAGAFLLERMKEAPHRFMFATDVETRSEVGFDLGRERYEGVIEYAASVPGYDAYLGMGSLSSADRLAIRYGNARVLYG